MGDALNHDHKDAGVAAGSDAAAPPEAATQVASGDAPASEPDPRGLGDLSSRGEERAEGSGEAASASGSEANHNGALELDLEELVARAEKADEYLELAKRTKADFENYRKRAVREAHAAQNRGVSKLALALLPAIDNLDRALAHADDAPAAELASGVKLVHDEILAALARTGIEPFSPQGEPFDPQSQEAVAQYPVPGAEPGTVAEVYQCGYRIGDSVLRPARVSVAE